MPALASRRSVWRTSSLAVAGLALVVAQAWSATSSTAARVSPGAAPGCAGQVDPSLDSVGSGATDVIVVGRPGADVARAVAHVGGHVLAEQAIVDGVRASVPAGKVRTLACSSAVVSVTPNRAVTFQSKDDEDKRGGGSSFVRATGAPSVAHRADSGAGVGVAVIDTGISPMNDVAGRVVYGPDLSGEGRIIDSYGHGTVMAGIIGGNGHDSAGAHAGMAPAATLISVKVAGRNGATDVSTVLQAMHWVDAYRTQFNIRVLNLSWGTPSTQSPAVDPLDYAVERLWRDGIVVVVAGGNAGPQSGTILKPGDDPMVLTVGAYNDGGTPGRSGDSMAQWSSAGPTAAGVAKPDLVAPGRTLVALRSYGSAVEANNAGSLVAPSYIKGSGTSEATAVTSGAAALLLAARPELTPDQVKHILKATARPMAGVPTRSEGSGRLSLHGALGTKAGPASWQQPVATGLGSLEASRGGQHVQVDCGEDGTPDVVIGEMTADCQPWDGSSWTGSSWTGSSWTGSSWTGSSWTGSSWTGSSWTGSSWTGSSWTGGTWAGSSWTGSSWTGSSWTGSSWTGSSWTGSSWTGSSWTTQEWNSSLSDFQTAWWGDEPPAGRYVPGESTG